VALSGRIVVLASGSGSNLQALLDAVADGRLRGEVVAVFVNRRSAYARTRAIDAGIPEFFTPMQGFVDAADGERPGREAYDAALAEQVSAFTPDVIVMAGWMHLFTNVFLDQFAGRIVNLHPALPGTFSGAHAIDDAWSAYQAGTIDRTGAMVHLVPDEGVDDGPVLLSREVLISSDDTRESMEAHIHAIEHELLVGAVANLLDTL
jgi:phosphoribosylglycinamide formyltransferase-1